MTARTDAPGRFRLAVDLETSVPGRGGADVEALVRIAHEDVCGAVAEATLFSTAPEPRPACSL